MPKMQEGFVNINNVPTFVTTFGRWVTEKSDKKELIVIIPANNGSTGFYKLFMRILHTKFNCPVWIIANSGHDINSKNPEPPRKTLNLKEQIEQKVAFFDKYVPDDAKVYLIGHSIGCYMALEMLENPKIEKKIFANYLLFPLIERLNEGKKGINMVKFEKYIWIVVFFAWILYILPEIISVNLLKIGKVPEKDIPYVLASSNPKVLNQVLQVADDELKDVRERNNDVIKKNIRKIRMLYEKEDGWLPLTCYDDLKKDLPDLRADLTCFKHAFYFETSVQVAEIVTNWITEDNAKKF